MTEFAEVKTQDLSGVALDWVVAQVEKVQTTYRYSRELVADHDGGGIKLILSIRPIYSPSTEWRLGGPLIERYAVTLTPFAVSFGGDPSYWLAQPWDNRVMPLDGLTPLIAACRAIVASVLGDTVSVPKELLS